MAEINLITQYDKKSPISEAYRAIRTNLQFACTGKLIKMISFTSATPSEGKSTTVSNLAVVMAQIGKRILLIDCDMRKPVQHKLFGLSNRGLSNCIATGISLDDVIQKNVIDNLDILPSGPVPPNPSEILCSDKMGEILKTVAAEYDYILLDTPPVLLVTDTVVIAAKVDGVVVLISSGEVSVDDARSAKTRLIQGGANILGVILNKVPIRHRYGYDYNYYYYDEEHNKHKGSHRD